MFFPTLYVRIIVEVGSFSFSLNQVIMISLTGRRRKRSLGLPYDEYFLDAIWAGRRASVFAKLHRDSFPLSLD